MISFKLTQTDPVCHGNEVFACNCHKSLASVKQQRATNTLGFATLSSFWQTYPTENLHKRLYIAQLTLTRYV